MTFVCAAAHDEMGAELFESRPGSGEIFRIARVIAHRHADDPVSLRHHISLLNLF